MSDLALACAEILDAWKCVPGANLQDSCIMHGFPGTDTIVEEEGHIGHAAVLHGCIVKRNALVGMNAVINDNAVIGESAIVAAMAFVKAGFVVPPRTLVAGIPAQAGTRADGTGNGLEGRGHAKLPGTHAAQPQYDDGDVATCGPRARPQADRGRRTIAAVRLEGREKELEARRLAVATGVRRCNVSVVGLDNELTGAEVHVGVGHRFQLVAERNQAGA